ncbi:hypothetical protein SNS2_4913 [Streptomyces netropsis]|nr:hypothetical protein SNS2_4913 [Streptomyces netropsis]
MQRIAVVGGGAAAACVVESLARTVREPCALTVLDGGGPLWRGRAYQPDSGRVLTNIHITQMSLRERDADHALRWLTRRAPGSVDDDGLTSRSLYGAYLDDTASRAWRRLAGRGWRLRTVREHVTRLLPDGDGVSVGTAGGRCEHFEHVVLCTGPTVPGDPYGLATSPRYMATPFPLARALATVPPDERVGVLGSGLTALDIVAELVARGHRSTIVLASRGGVLPAVRRRSSPDRPRHLTLTCLERNVAAGKPFRTADLLKLLRNELRTAGVGEAGVLRELALTEPAVERLRRQLRDADDAGLGILRQALHRFAGHAWNLLPDAEKAALWQRHGRAVTSLCCPMPQHRAELLLRLLESGQLQLLGGLSDVVPRPPGGFDLVTRDAVAGVGTLFNALNPAAPGTGAPSVPEVFVTRRLDIGHPLGGLRTDRTTHRVPGAHNGRAGLYALGHSTRGSVLFQFGMPSLVYQSGLVARAIAACTDTPWEPDAPTWSAQGQGDPGG